MPGSFEQLKIDNTLSDAESAAINALENLKKEDLTKALKDDKIDISGQKRSITEIADIFSDCVTQVDGNLTISKENKVKEPWLEDMIKNGQDLAYFLFVVAKYLNITWSEKLDAKAINTETITQLKLLKDLVNKKETAPSNTETSDTLTEADINFKLYSGLQKSDVLSAVTDLKKTNAELAKKIIPLLKAGDVIWVQKALGMEETATALYKKADGKFGRNTLENLRNGKIVARTGNGGGNGGWTENGDGGNGKGKWKEKNKNKTPENDETTPENITSIDQLPITEPPAAVPTKEYHMEMNMYGNKLNIVFYPNYAVKFTASNGKEISSVWSKTRDGILTIDMQSPFPDLKFKTQEEFVLTCNAAIRSIEQKAKTPEKSKKSSRTPLELVLGSLFFASVVPFAMPVVLATAPIVAGGVAPVVWPVLAAKAVFWSKDKNENKDKKTPPTKTSTYDPFDHRQGYGI